MLLSMIQNGFRSIAEIKEKKKTQLDALIIYKTKIKNSPTTKPFFFRKRRQFHGCAFSSIKLSKLKIEQKKFCEILLIEWNGYQRRFA